MVMDVSALPGVNDGHLLSEQGQLNKGDVKQSDVVLLEDQLCDKALNAFSLAGGKVEVVAVHLSNGQEFVGVAEAPGLRAERSLNYALMGGRKVAEGEACPTQQLRVTVKPGPEVTFTRGLSL